MSQAFLQQLLDKVLNWEVGIWLLHRQMQSTAQGSDLERD